ncbi:MAG: DNA-directed RNA polymerase subunit alpha [Candidatus Magasanikbacteria bacterium]|nr:DNA-directed RNA polymerase subunit alpha [Candidatus Magasanikbacteria bacterium]
MEQILLPTTIEFMGGENSNIGTLLITPCHQGYGTTLGNALRRVLLSSLPGAAVESIKIAGVQHEFSVLEGVLEDVIEIILNVKQIAVISHSDQPVTITLSKKGIGDVTAGDFSKNSDIEIVNPDLKLATITDKNKVFEMEITIGRGRGYVPVSEKETRNLSLGTIAIDSLYTPIRDVGYSVEMTRVGDVTDYEKLSMTIETNGTVAPKDAVEQATKILMDHFALILGADFSAEPTKESVKTVNVEEEVDAVVGSNEDVEVDENKETVKKAKKKSKKVE